jgi:flagellar hook-basal body complex protein FliE
MNEIDVNGVLAQIRAMQAQAVARPVAPPVAGAPGGFETLLRGAIGSVNQSQVAAQDLQSAFERGDSSTDLSNVMLATAKAQVSFKAMVEVRNRLVNAYQEIMNMPI